MNLIQPGADAPAFELESHGEDRVSSTEILGNEQILLVFYPLDFTPT